MENTIIDIVGYAAAICMVSGYLPQAIYTIRTRDTEGIAMPTFLLMGLGSLFFLIQGILLSNWPLSITNLLTLICAVIIFSIKIHNDYFKKRH
ncbi:MAG: glutathione synthetase [Muribaculaceae bacterium]|nr:glutathione synthetase [Muribaculaceae bacterium]